MVCAMQMHANLENRHFMGTRETDGCENVALWIHSLFLYYRMQKQEPDFISRSSKLFVRMYVSQCAMEMQVRANPAESTLHA